MIAIDVGGKGIRISGRRRVKDVQFIPATTATLGTMEMVSLGWDGFGPASVDVPVGYLNRIEIGEEVSDFEVTGTTNLVTIVRYE